VIFPGESKGAVIGSRPYSIGRRKGAVVGSRPYSIGRRGLP